MGADIHIFRERKINGVWETDSEYEGGEDYGYVDTNISISRYYLMFGVLSNVRVDNPYPKIKSPAIDRGFPGDIAEIHKNVLEDADYHSHGYLYVSELKKIIEELKPYRTEALLGMHKDNKYATSYYLEYANESLKSLLTQVTNDGYFAGCDEATEARILIAYDN